MTSSLPFDSLSPTEQRRAIAADVIAQLHAKRFVVACGNFFVMPAEPNGPRQKEVSTLRAFLEGHRWQEKTCSVCALGAIMMAQLNVNGDCAIEEADIYLQFPIVNSTVGVMPFQRSSEGNRLGQWVTRYFSPDQLALIEIAFELGRGAFSCNYAVDMWYQYGVSDHYDEAVEIHDIPKSISVREASAAISFGKAYPHPERRLIAIMHSIMEHPEALFEP